MAIISGDREPLNIPFAKWKNSLKSITGDFREFGGIFFKKNIYWTSDWFSGR